MGIIVFIIGFIAGLFLWASIVGTLFLTLPKLILLKRKKRISNIKLIPIIIPLVFAAVVLVPGYIISLSFAWGASIGGLMILFNLRNLRNESDTVVNRDYLFNNNKVYKKIQTQNNSQHKDSLRERLKRDFNKDLEISGGDGQSRDEPIIINKVCKDYVGTEYYTIELIYTAMGQTYEIVKQTLLKHKGRDIDQIKIAVAGDESNYYNFYFDVTDHIRKR